MQKITSGFLTTLLPKKDKGVNNTLLNFPLVKDDAELIFCQSPLHVPFTIQRVYFIKNIKPGSIRGKHAHKKTKQILICLRGSVKVLLDNGKTQKTFTLTNANQGIFLDKLVWHEMFDFQDNPILLVLASKKYMPSDYIRDYDTFRTYVI